MFHDADGLIVDDTDVSPPAAIFAATTTSEKLRNKSACVYPAGTDGAPSLFMTATRRFPAVAAANDTVAVAPFADDDAVVCRTSAHATGHIPTRASGIATPPPTLVLFEIQYSKGRSPRSFCAVLAASKMLFHTFSRCVPESRVLPIARQ